MSYLQQIDALEANNWTSNNIQTEPSVALKSSPDDTQHSEQYHDTMIMRYVVD